MKISTGIRLKVLKTALYALYLFLIVFILLEVLLRIYDPFKFRIKANRIILPVSQQQIIKNIINPRLDPVIYNTRNDLGFRGPDTPNKFHQQLSIITVGGSTTECHFLSDQKTWPFLLGELLKNDFRNVWLNNAGLEGLSTFGHEVLLNDYLLKLKPRVILFLTGVNDIENDGPSFFDKLNKKNAYPDFLHYLYNNSEVVNLAVNISRGSRAQKFNNTTQQLKVPGGEGELMLNDAQKAERSNHQLKYVEAYGVRVEKLIRTCKSNGILPVFLTQPCLYGKGIDSLTGVNLSTARVEEGMNGELLFLILDMYNNKVKDVCKKMEIPCFDLATVMPKNSLYYYDQTHFTNEGAAVVAGITSERLKEILNSRFPRFRIVHD